MLIGFLAIVTCAHLAAVFLVAEARREVDSELLAYFRRRAILAAVAAGALAIAGVDAPRSDAPSLADELPNRGWPLVVASGAMGTAVFVLLRRGAARGTAALAAGAVVWRWGVARYPGFLPGSLALTDAAAPDGSLARWSSTSSSPQS